MSNNKKHTFFSKIKSDKLAIYSKINIKYYRKLQKHGKMFISKIRIKAIFDTY